MNEQDDTSGETVINEGENEATGFVPAARLELVRGGTPTGDAFPVSERTIVGRFDPGVGPVDVDLGLLPEGVYVSRKHAEVYFEGGKWFIRDLGSSNGTFVLFDGGDFEKIDGPIELQNGQQVAFGNAKFIFSVMVERTSAEGQTGRSKEGDEERAEDAEA